eukprot:TRINITY_DN27853_c0_g1_i1.p1 TRINITY_DN27853_c0_g1~~TRINITY_DN27853_c0_g1_i1.p1  ORF type:complete len:697 (+),score=181.73 TRINITY_DN27853_c0_g1_i1:79-2091(+)
MEVHAQMAWGATCCINVASRDSIAALSQRIAAAAGVCVMRLQLDGEVLPADALCCDTPLHGGCTVDVEAQLPAAVVARYAEQLEQAARPDELFNSLPPVARAERDLLWRALQLVLRHYTTDDKGRAIDGLLQCTTPELSVDEAVLAKVMPWQGHRVAEMPAHIRDNADMMLDAITSTPEAMRHVSPRLRGDRDFVTLAAMGQLRVLPHIPEKFHTDESVFAELLGSDGHHASDVLQAASAAQRASLSIARKAVEASYRAVAHVAQPLVGDRQFMLHALHSIGRQQCSDGEFEGSDRDPSPERDGSVSSGDFDADSEEQGAAEVLHYRDRAVAAVLSAAAPDLKEDSEFMECAVALSPVATVRHMSRAMRSDKGMMLKALRAVTDASSRYRYRMRVRKVLRYAQKCVLRDKEFFTAAVTADCGEAVPYASAAMLRDRDVMLCMLPHVKRFNAERDSQRRNTPIDYTSEAGFNECMRRQDEDYPYPSMHAPTTVSIDFVFRTVDTSLCTDAVFVAAALRTHHEAVQYLTPQLRRDPDVMLSALLGALTGPYHTARGTYTDLLYASYPLLSDVRFAARVAESAMYAWQHIPRAMWSEADVSLGALKLVYSGDEFTLLSQYVGLRAMYDKRETDQQNSAADRPEGVEDEADDADDDAAATASRCAVASWGRTSR